MLFMILACFGATNVDSSHSCNFLMLQVEALAFLCLCCIVCLSGCIRGLVGTRFTSEIWPSCVDRSCRCLAVRVCVDKVNDVLALDSLSCLSFHK